MIVYRSEYSFSIFILASLLLGWCHASKILVLVPTAAISHQKPFQILTKALLERGHQVTFYTANPLKIPHENLTEVDVSPTYIAHGEFDFVKMSSQSPLETVPFLNHYAQTIVPLQLNDPAVKDFIRRNETYDAVILEWITYQAFYGLVHRVGSPPLIGMITLSAFSPVYYAMGNAMNPAYIPDVWVGFSDHMSFWERLYNTVFYVRCYYLWFWENMPEQEAFMREHFGADPSPVHETERNFSLLIINNHFTLEYPRPHLPNVIETTGMHVETQNKPLPKRIQEFMDGAEHGVVYFSLGSNVKSSVLPREKVQAFIDAFRELPQRVLWKWESDSLPQLPANVMVSKWLPQQDVLVYNFPLQFFNRVNGCAIHFAFEVTPDKYPKDLDQLILEDKVQVRFDLSIFGLICALDAVSQQQQGRHFGTPPLTAHPKVSLFVMQGGLQSLNEATYHGVPLLVIPFFSDQAHNAAKVQQAEMGLRMDFSDVTKDTVLRNMRAILEDPKYKENMKRLSAVYREHQADSLDRAVWWIEYVIRHKGAPHMRSAALDLYWWQLLLLDVIAFVLLVLIICVGAIWYLVRRLFAKLRSSKPKHKKR